MALTAETLVRCGVPAEKARAHLPLIASAMREHEITTPVRARMFLAQVMHESAALRYFEEIASGAAYEGRADLGNVRPGDGRRFKGRGPIQLTGRHNYTLYGKLLGLDLVRRPELAATPRVGWRTAALYFQRAGCNQAADRKDFKDVTRRINGGLNGYDDRVRYYNLLGGAGVVPGRAHLGRGDSGDAVVTMTRRLSFVRAKGTGKPYLDGKRQKFDGEAERALRAFQEDHGLLVDGRYGPNSTRALAKATAREKARKGSDPSKGVGERSRSPRKRSAADILARMEQVDRRGDALRAELLKRARALERAQRRRERLDPDDLRTLAEQLRRLDAIVDDVQGALAAAERPAITQRAEPAVAAKPGTGNGGTATATATAVAAEPATETALDELLDRLVALDAEGDRLRGEVAERFERLEPRRPRDSRPAGGRPRTTKPKPEDGPRGEGTVVRQGERSFRIRQSKVALARYLGRHRRQSTGKLRRALLREARSPKQAKVATPAWRRAVREAQAIAGLEPTGELDGRLQKLLRPHWPSESAMRRLVRGTPAWRLIPGQLSPNFNVREFGCSDGTPYVTGLVREQGITKAQAKQRAKALADRLERVRAAGGDRPLRVTSVFRTRSYNATLPGAATNSAHTRGFAADVPPPAGVPLATHHRHVRAAFESGVGLYTSSNFVHGDFDPQLGRRNW